MEDNLPRRLSVIMYADGVEYSRLMGDDEDATLHILGAYLDLLSERIVQHRGVVINYAGDAVLAKFDAVVNALTCAISIQNELATKNETLPIERRVRFRIGINLGDVIEDRGDIYGDGVNIAARLEGLAEPGGVCISGLVRSAVGDSLPVNYEDLGNQFVKNIEKPVRTFAIHWPLGESFSSLIGRSDRKVTVKRNLIIAAICTLVTVIGLSAWFNPWAPKRSLGLETTTTLPLPDEPSIAVLPFDNMSGDPSQDDFVDGLTENIISSLSRFEGLFVIARHSSFKYRGKPVDIRDIGRELGVRYVLEGSVQKSSENVRVTAQLIEAATAGHVWADRIDRPLSGLFEVQDAISDHIVGVIAPVSAGTGKLQKMELDRVLRTPTENLKAYDYFLRGVSHYNRFNRDDNLLARQMFEQALLLDSSYARAIARNSWTYLQDYWNGWGKSPNESLKTSEQLSRKAISLDPNDTAGYWSLASSLLLLKKHDAAIRRFKQALELNPNDADVLMHYGWSLAYAGRSEEAIPLMLKAIRLNPYYPGWYLYDVAWAYFVAYNYQDAIAALERREPKTNFTFLLLAASYVQVDRLDDAEKAMRKFRDAEPDYTVAKARETEPFKYKKDLEHFLGALRDAGLPE